MCEVFLETAQKSSSERSHLSVSANMIRERYPKIWPRGPKQAFALAEEIEVGPHREELLLVRFKGFV